MTSTSEHIQKLYGSIYECIRNIPKGYVATYGQVAELANRRGAARVVARALRLSKGHIHLPWQRVVGKQSEVWGRIAIRDPIGAAMQKALLQQEGVEVDSRGKIRLDTYGLLTGKKERDANSQKNKTKRWK